jgi:hypothetical protein
MNARGGSRIVEKNRMKKNVEYLIVGYNVATLTLGSQPRHGFIRGWAKERDPRVWESVRMNSHTPK